MDSKCILSMFLVENEEKQIHKCRPWLVDRGRLLRVCEAVEIGSIPCCRGRNGHSSAWCDCLNKILKIVLVVIMTNAHNVLAVVFSYLFINMTYVHTYAYTERISTQALAILWLFSNPTLKILVADPANIFWAVMHTLTQIIRYRK